VFELIVHAKPAYILLRIVYNCRQDVEFSDLCAQWMFGTIDKSKKKVYVYIYPHILLLKHILSSI